MWASRLAGSGYAHHGFNVEFDGTKCMDLKGTLTVVSWENPHAYLQMDVPDASGKAAHWHLEMITPNALKRNGTTRQDFAANMGKVMHARACPAKVASGGDSEARRNTSSWPMASFGSSDSFPNGISRPKS